MLKKVIKHFFSFPCAGCKSDDAVSSVEFCNKCIEKLNIIHGPFCPCCGGVLDGILGVCSKCLKEEDTPWESAVAVMHMKGFGRELIQRFKYKNDTSLLKPLASLAVNALKDSDINYDLILPIPLHWRRRYFRGYNQSALIAKQISKITSVNYKTVLYRKKYTQPQTKLSGKQRRKNLKNVFALRNRESIRDKNILLVDDVFTTGSTLRAATKPIFEADAKSVSILVLARR